MRAGGRVEEAPAGIARRASAAGRGRPRRPRCRRSPRASMGRCGGRWRRARAPVDALHAAQAPQTPAPRSRAASRRRRRASAPAPTVSRLVPRRSSWASRSRPRGRRDPEHRDHRRDADGDPERGERRAQRAACAGRRAPRRSRSAGSRREPSSVVARPGRRAARSRRGSAAARSRSWVMTTTVVPSALSSRSRARTSAPERESRLPVGSSAKHDRRPRDDRAGDRDALALAAGELLGRWSRRCPSPTRSSAVRAAAVRCSQPACRCRAGRRRRSPARSSRRAGRTAGRRSRSTSRAAPASSRSSRSGDVDAGHRRRARASGGRACPSRAAASTCPSPTGRRRRPARRRRRRGSPRAARATPPGYALVTSCSARLTAAPPRACPGARPAAGRPGPSRRRTRRGVTADQAVRARRARPRSRRRRRATSARDRHGERVLRAPGLQRHAHRRAVEAAVATAVQGHAQLDRRRGAVLARRVATVPTSVTLAADLAAVGQLDRHAVAAVHVGGQAGVELRR